MTPMIFSLARQFLLTFAVIAAFPVSASDHGGGASGPEPLQFTVNLGKTGYEMRYLQVTMVPEFATPEVAHHFAGLKPKVQHRMILLLSSEDVDSLRTLKGKQELQERIVGDMNGLLDETPKTGVKEIFFTNFIIQ